MAHIFACLLTLLFSLSSPAMGANGDFWRSSIGAYRSALEAELRIVGQEARTSGAVLNDLLRRVP